MKQQNETSDLKEFREKHWDKSLPRNEAYKKYLNLYPDKTSALKEEIMKTLNLNMNSNPLALKIIDLAISRTEEADKKEIIQLRKTISVYAKKINRLKKQCTKYNRATTLRLQQIRNTSKLFDKLKKEGKITNQELKEAILSKRQVKEQLKW